MYSSSYYQNFVNILELTMDQGTFKWCIQNMSLKLLKTSCLFFFFFFFLIHHYLTSWCFWNFLVTFYGGNVVCAHKKKCCLCSCWHLYFIFALPLAFLIFSPAAYKCFEFFSSKEIRLLWFFIFRFNFFSVIHDGRTYADVIKFSAWSMGFQFP